MPVSFYDREFLMDSMAFIVIAVIVTTIGFLIGYQMIRMQKM